MGPWGVTVIILLFPRATLDFECFGTLLLTLHIWGSEKKIGEVSIIFVLCKQGFGPPYPLLETPLQYRLSSEGGTDKVL